MTVLPDLEGTPIFLSLEQTREFYAEIVKVGKEIAERNST